MYYNSKLKKFELLLKNEVDLDIHYSKNKNKYKVFDSNNILLQTTLNFENILKENAFSQFRYMCNRACENQKEFIITDVILTKLKIKSRNYNFINYKLIIESL